MVMESLMDFLVFLFRKAIVGISVGLMLSGLFAGNLRSPRMRE
jgi:uncharacterized membrane protein